MIVICIKQHPTFEGQFMKKLSNIEAESKRKRCLLKKACNQRKSRSNGIFYIA